MTLASQLLSRTRIIMVTVVILWIPHFVYVYGTILVIKCTYSTLVVFIFIFKGQSRASSWFSIRTDADGPCEPLSSLWCGACERDRFDRQRGGGEIPLRSPRNGTAVLCRSSCSHKWQALLKTNRVSAERKVDGGRRISSTCKQRGWFWERTFRTWTRTVVRRRGCIA